MRENLNESGVSEVVGTVLLIALVVLGVAIVAAALLSQPNVTEVPHASIVAGENASGNFVLVHEGGDALSVGEYRVYVGDGTNLEDETANFTAPADGVWSLGENITYTGSAKPERVIVTAVTGRGETILAEPAFDGGGTTVFSPDPVDPGTGGGSVTPTPTPQPITIVLPTAGGNLSTKQQEFVATVNSSNTAYVHMVLYNLEDVGNAGEEDRNEMIVMNMTQNKTVAFFYNHTIDNLNFLQQGNDEVKISMTVIAYDKNGTPIASNVEIGTLKKSN